MTIQDNVKWHKHIQAIGQKINKYNGILYLTRHLLTKKALKQMYYALVYPNIIYCQTVWGKASSVALKQVITSQKRMLRTIAGAHRYAHTNSIFSELGILKLEDVNIYCCALYVFKSINR